MAYWETGVMLEAFVSITSGLVLWIGAWDALEIVLPPGWPWRLLLVAIGIFGLYSTRTMYEESLVKMMRGGRGERVDAAVGVGTATGGDRSRNAEAAGTSSGSGEASEEAELGGASMLDNVSRGSDEASPSPAAASAQPLRPFHDAPRLDARKCCRALYVIMAGLLLWVGLWDLIDYTLLPLVFRGSAFSCKRAEAQPGPRQILEVPGCLFVKLLAMTLGIVGLWATRSLYGSDQEQAAQFTRFQ